MAYSIFIIYKREDAAEADKIFKRLEREGYSPWIDRENQKIIDWEAASEEKLEKSNLILVCLSKNGDKPGRYHQEISLALKRNENLPPGESLIVPVRIDDCELPRKLKKIQSFDLFQGDGWNHLLRALREKRPPARRVQPPVRVLVWDDEQIWRQLVREKVEDVVRSMGRQPECHEVEKFSKALSMLSEGHWDLLVTDIADTEADKSSIGMNLADKARQLKIRCIVVSGDIVLTKKHTHTLGKMGAEYYAKGDFATSLDEFMNEVRKVCK